MCKTHTHLHKLYALGFIMSVTYIEIKDGMYKGNVVNGRFALAEAFRVLPSGKPIVKVYGQGTFGMTQGVRVAVQVQPGTFTYMDEYGNEVQIDDSQKDANLLKWAAPVVPGTEIDPSLGDKIFPTASGSYEDKYRKIETEEEALNRIRETFRTVDDLVDCVIEKTVRGLIVSGPPGVGKSHSIEVAFSQFDTLTSLKGTSRKNYEIVTGAATPIALYKKLWEYRDSDQFLIFDDCDGLLFDEDTVNMLKHALDSKKKRYIHYLAESRVLAKEDIPSSFEYNGSIIFLSNVNFRTFGRGRIAEHLKAIVSRCHYMNLELNTDSDKMLRIRQVVADGMLDDLIPLEEDRQIIVEYVEVNKNHLTELSLRMVIKIAQLYAKHKGGKWVELVETSCMNKEAKFKRLYQQKIGDAIEDMQPDAAAELEIPVNNDEPIATQE